MLATKNNLVDIILGKQRRNIHLEPHLFICNFFSDTIIYKVYNIINPTDNLYWLIARLWAMP